MQLTGDMLIGGAAVRGKGGQMRAVNPSNGSNLDPSFAGGTLFDVDHACELAWAAFDAFRETGLEVRAGFLESIAEQLLALGDSLIERACAETGLPRGRIEGERGRTVGQLRLFAEVVRDGGWIEARIDPAQPSRTPMPRSDLRQRHIGIGSRRRVRRQQLSARFFRGRRRYGFGARGRLSRGGKSASRTPRHVRVGWTGYSGRCCGLRITGRGVLSACRCGI